MKKIKFEGKLNLNKEVVSKLNDGEMSGMMGGVKRTRGPRCQGQESIICTISLPCMIDEDSSPILCSPDLPTTIRP